MKPQPWEPADATDYIRALGRDKKLSLWQTEHYKYRLMERDLLQGDALYLLKNGFVFEKPLKITRGLYKYAIEGKTPNSESRSIRLIVIPDLKLIAVKFVSIMWIDEIVIEEEE